MNLSEYLEHAIVGDRVRVTYSDGTGLVGFVEPRHVAYEQALADEFLKLGIIPRQLDIASVVWTPQTAS